MSRAYLTLSEMKNQMVTANTDADFESNGHKMIASASRAIEIWTRRRFDPHYTMIRHDPRLKRHRGDVVDYTLVPRSDLKSIDVLTNGDGTTIDIGSDIDIQYDSSFITDNITGIILTNDTLNWEQNANTRRRDDIQVTGFWGYGWRWITTALTVSTEATAGLTQIVLSAYDGLEQDVLILIGSEIMRVSADLATNPTFVEVERGYNGTTDATHATSAGVSIVVYHPTVDRLMRRLMGWYDGQNTSPLFGEMVIGDVSLPIDISSMPKDVKAMASELTPIGPISAVGYT